LCGSNALRAQEINRHETILIDASGSVGKGAGSELFRDYLRSAKRLLLTEPPNSWVSVSVISTDSFGGVQELVKGWTPDARGVFTDSLDGARHQLAASFEEKSAGLTPSAAGTDIFGALWRVKTMVESAPHSGGRHAHTEKVIWIFSDMMNETPQFPMPALIPLGPQGMLRKAKSNGLVVPLKGYQIHVLGASTAGLSPQSWIAIQEFWTRYFADAGAELVSYSPETEANR
jgi:hypothetical protein